MEEGRHPVTPFEGLEEGVPLNFEVAGRSILVVRWHGEVFAVRNICPHQSQVLSYGQVRPFVYGKVCEGPPSSAGGRGWDLVSDPEMPIVQCPWHAWEFRLADGVCATDERFRVRSYATEVDDEGMVYLLLNAKR